MSFPNFASDHHFDHANVIKYCNRPFNNVEDMNEFMIAEHNKVVPKDGTTWFLGDFCFTRKAERIAYLLCRLNGKINWLAGNHDNLQLMNEVAETTSHLSIYFGHVDLKVGDKPVVLCHFPFETWNKGHHGSYHLHGHEHGNLGECKDRRRLDVGVDTNKFKPYTWAEVDTLLKNKPTFESHRTRKNK